MHSRNCVILFVLKCLRCVAPAGVYFIFKLTRSFVFMHFVYEQVCVSKSVNELLDFVLYSADSLCAANMDALTGFSELFYEKGGDFFEVHLYWRFYRK